MHTRIAIDVAALPATAARTIGFAAVAAPVKHSRQSASSAGTAAALLLRPCLVTFRHAPRARTVLAGCLELVAPPDAGREPRSCLAAVVVWLACWAAVRCDESRTPDEARVDADSGQRSPGRPAGNWVRVAGAALPTSAGRVESAVARTRSWLRSLPVRTADSP